VRRSRQKGAAAVELAMTLPIALLLIGGTVYLGRALHARGRLADAVGYAARAEAIAAATRPNGTVDQGSILAMVNGRVAGENDCIQPISVTYVVGGVVPYRYLDVTAQCQLTAPILGAFLPNFSLNTVEATASMPLDYEVPQ
jgi:hypothetical protein